jgi:hypothetical protein
MLRLDANLVILMAISLESILKNEKVYVLRGLKRTESPK